MTEGLQHLGRGFPRASGPEPVVLPYLITIVPTSNDLPCEALEVVRAFIVRGILNRVLGSELLERKVGEVVDTVEDPQRYQRLDRVHVKLREADVQVE